MFADETADLLFAGDHVLPRITPSIGFEPAPPTSPLADFLTSLELIRSRPDAALLPAHGPVGHAGARAGGRAAGPPRQAAGRHAGRAAGGSGHRGRGRGRVDLDSPGAAAATSWTCSTPCWPPWRRRPTSRFSSSDWPAPPRNETACDTTGCNCRYYPACPGGFIPCVAGRCARVAAHRAGRGAVLDGWDLRGGVLIDGPDVTVRRSRIAGAGSSELGIRTTAAARCASRTAHRPVIPAWPPSTATGGARSGSRSSRSAGTGRASVLLQKRSEPGPARGADHRQPLPPGRRGAVAAALPGRDPERQRLPRPRPAARELSAPDTPGRRVALERRTGSGQTCRTTTAGPGPAETAVRHDART